MNWLYRIHRKAFITLLIADAILLPLGEYLGSMGVRSWMISGAVLILNLPAIPLAVAFSIILGDEGPGRRESQMVMVCAIVSVHVLYILFSSWCWAFVARNLFRPASQDPIDAGHSGDR